MVFFLFSCFVSALALLGSYLAGSPLRLVVPFLNLGQSLVQSALIVLSDLGHERISINLVILRKIVVETSRIVNPEVTLQKQVVSDCERMVFVLLNALF